jgi:hypothetical protein
MNRGTRRCWRPKIAACVRYRQALRLGVEVAFQLARLGQQTGDHDADRDPLDQGFLAESLLLAVLGGLAGLYPASRAARLAPTVAPRSV